MIEVIDRANNEIHQRWKVHNDSWNFVKKQEENSFIGQFFETSSEALID